MSGIGWREASSVAALALIGSAFVAIYGARVTGASEFLAFAFAVAYAGAFLVLRRIDLPRALAGDRGFASISLAVTGAIILLMAVTPAESRVGRLPALIEWNERLLDGTFPWGGPAGPSGFPVLFLVALPFVLAGIVAYLAAGGIALAAFCVARVPEPKDRMLRFGMLLLLPPVWYEILTRSELLLNATGALAVVLVAERYLREDRIDARFIGIAVLAGLVLSTRAVVAIPFATWGAWRFRDRWGNGTAFAAIAGATFALTLLPFVLWDPSRFVADGPFRLQGRHAPGWVPATALLLAVVAGFRARTIGDVLFAAGAILFLAVATPFVRSVLAAYGLVPAADIGFDVGYLVLPIPFLVLVLRRGGKRSTNRAQDERSRNPY